MVQLGDCGLGLGLFDPVLRDLAGRLLLVLLSELYLPRQRLDCLLLLRVCVGALVHLGQGFLRVLQLVTVFLGAVCYSLLLLLEGLDPAVIQLDLPLGLLQGLVQVLLLRPQRFHAVGLPLEFGRDLLRFSIELLQVGIDV